MNDYLTDQLDALEALTAALSPEHPDVRAARRLVTTLRARPALRRAPLHYRHAVADTRAVTKRLRALQPQGDTNAR